MTTYCFKPDSVIADAVLDLHNDLASWGASDEMISERVNSFLAQCAELHPDHCWAKPDGTVH